jgi:hypothetical protein
MRARMHVCKPASQRASQLASKRARMHAMAAGTDVAVVATVTAADAAALAVEIVLAV